MAAELEIAMMSVESLDHSEGLDVSYLMRDIDIDDIGKYIMSFLSLEPYVNFDWVGAAAELAEESSADESEDDA